MALISSRGGSIKMAIVAVLAVGSATLLALSPNVRTLVQQGLDMIRTAGPGYFFLAMALLPAIGAPLSLFCLTAGSIFGPRLGMPLAILLSLAAIAANIAISYVLASRGLRPLLVYLLSRLGYQLPKVQSGDVTDVIVLLRVTPGLPFPVQNYLLGLASVPFGRYLVLSCLIAFPLNAAIIFFGGALLQGQGRMALAGLLFLLAVMTAIHMVRRHLKAKVKAGAPPSI